MSVSAIINYKLLLLSGSTNYILDNIACVKMLVSNLNARSYIIYIILVLEEIHVFALNL